MTVTAKDNYWRIDDWYDTHYGRVAKTHVIGQARNEDDKIVYVRPVPPARATDIINWGKPVEEQVFVREEVPEFWTWKYLNRVAEEHHTIGVGRGKIINYNWWRNDDNLSQEQWEYKNREWERRLNGVDILIGGEIVYLTGLHYTYLQHWWLDGKAPEFRERDLLWFYTMQHVIDDPMCYGKIEPKHRRAGDTSKAAFVGWEKVSRTFGGHFGIQATGEDQSGKVYTDKVLPGWKRLVPFFSPIVKSGTNPVTELVMDVESRRGAAKHVEIDGVEGLEAWIRPAPKGKKGSVPFDGDKLHFFLRDEGGKAVDENILDTWDIIKPCLLVDGLPEKALYPSTVEDIEGDNHGLYEELFRDSMPGLALTTGTLSTVSGLKAVFIPCICGHSDIFIGKYGESIVHKPAPAQREWLLANRAKNEAHRRTLSEMYELGGAYEFELRERAKTKNLIDHCRRFPFTVEEVFAPSNPNSDFNVENIGKGLMQLAQPTASGVSLYTELTVQGNLEWVDEFKGEVKFVQTSKGRFIFNKAYMPGQPLGRRLGIEANAVTRGPARQFMNEKWGVVRPSSESFIKIGTDPQKTAAVDRKKGRRYSSAAAYGFVPYNPLMEEVKWSAQAEIDPEFARDWVTHAFIFEYLVLPKDPRQHHEDMLKACIFMNAKMLYERQLNELGRWFREVGCYQFLITDREWIKNKDNATAGIHSDPAIIELYKSRIKVFTDYHVYPGRCPFPQLLRQWVEFKIEDIEKFDAVVASGFTLMAAQPGPLRPDEKKSDIARPDDGKPKGIDNLITLHV